MKTEIAEARKELGRLVRERRKAMGLSGEELAKKAGKISRCTMHSIERGTRVAGLKVADRLARALKLNKFEYASFMRLSILSTKFGTEMIRILDL